MDYGHEWTDKELKKLEARIAREYKLAAEETAAKLEEYYKRHEVKKKIKLKELADGKIDEKEYKRWLIGQLAIGQRWQEMVDTLTEDYRNTNRIVYSMTREFTYEAYALNHNYGTFEAEKGSHIDTSYTLYDRQTVERLIRDDPQLLPPPGRRMSQKIAEGSAVLWNKQVIQSLMTQSILQGESIGKIADRMQRGLSPSFTIEDIRNQDRKTAKQIANELARKNRNAAIRNARTMTTSAQNAGRYNAYKRAQSMGIRMRTMWVAMLDNRTRHYHRVLDGQKVDVGQPFKVDDYTIRYPGDPQAAPEMKYNCRCRIIGVVAGTQMDMLEAKDLPRISKLGDTSYEEWEKGHYQPKPKYNKRNKKNKSR